MSHMERGLTVVKIAHSVHEKIPENTVWRAGKRTAHCHRIEPEAFADRCGFARSYMSRIERGGSNASLDAIEVLANALSVEPWQLLAPGPSEDNDSELLVPYAADGSCFHPGLASTRDGSFGVGDKAAQKRFGTFAEALEYLRSMETAKWRRPNPSGNWGIVSAVRWDKLRK